MSPITLLSDIQSSFRKMKIVTIASAVLGIVVALGSLYFAYSFASAQTEHVWIINDGSALLASRSDNAAQRDREVMAHLTRFHELMFNLSPNLAVIDEHVRMAQALGLQPATDIDKDRRERQFYTRLVQMKAVEDIVIDSMRINVLSYPYTAHTWARLYITRESNSTMYNFETECRLLEAQRSLTNPNGLQVDKFNIVKEQLVETAKR